MKIERTHDKFYLNEERRNKEYFKLVYSELNSDFGNNSFSLLDIGCATGDFLHFVKKEFPNVELCGMDTMPELLERVDHGIETFCANIADYETLPTPLWKKYDCITMMGVITIFDDFQPVLDNAFLFLKDSGIFYLFDFFNPENLDVLIKSKPSGLDFSDNVKWESGWNCFSMSTIRSYCESRGYQCDFIPFHIGIEIPRHENDPLRSWTEKTENGYMVVNGLQLVHHFYLCKIYKKS
jgi:SAM-dependent methyltransferase